MKLLKELAPNTDGSLCKSTHATIKNSFEKKHSIQSTTKTEFSNPNSLAETFVNLDLNSHNFSQRFKKQRVVPEKTIKEKDEEDKEDRGRMAESDEFDYIRESHSISRNRISLRGMGRLRRHRIFKIRKPKTDYMKIQNPDIEYDLLDVHFE